MAWLGVSLLVLSSTIVIPNEGELDADEPVIAPPGPVGPARKETGTQAESPDERERRLRREGIRKAPPAIPSRDYVSVLKRQESPDDPLPNLPPELWFGFGFGSWLPLSESDGRVSVPFGSHHIFAQVWSLGDRHRSGDPCSSSSTCRFDGIHAFVLSTSGSMEIAGLNRRTEERIRYSIEFSDLDWGAAWRRDWLWTMEPAGTYQLGTGLMAGWLPLRQRSIVQYGQGAALEKDLVRSGLQFNPSGFVLRGSFSALAVSRFEGAVFAGLNTGFPAELRLWFGLEIAMRSPRLPAKTEERQEPTKEATDKRYESSPEGRMPPDETNDSSSQDSESKSPSEVSPDTRGRVSSPTEERGVGKRRKRRER